MKLMEWINYPFKCPNEIYRFKFATIFKHAIIDRSETTHMGLLGFPPKWQRKSQIDMRVFLNLHFRVKQIFIAPAFFLTETQ